MIGVGRNNSDLLLNYERFGELNVTICLEVISCVMLCLVIIRIRVVING